jgi:3'-5' exonuclease
MQLPAPGRHPWIYVERQEHLEAVAEVLADSEVIALDAEFVQVRTRGPDDPPHRLALLQLAASPGVPGAYVVDALRIPDLSALGGPLQDPRILKLFHGIGADARVLRTRNLEAQHTLDLEAVSRSIFGQRESGLQTMLLRACGLRLDKSLQRSDWTRRPLTPAMLGYAARDAEMTLVLYTWLRAHYPWAVEQHVVPAHETPPEIAAWIVPFLDGPRPQRAEWAAAAAGLEDHPERQVQDLRAALAAVRRPPQRARVLRLIGDLQLGDLTPDILPVLNAQASDERAAAVRALGHLRAQDAEPALRASLDDPTEDVREAAHAALDLLAGPPPAPRAAHMRPAHAGSWTSGDADEGAQPAAAWQTLLRTRFRQESETPSLDGAQADGAQEQK